MHVLHIRILLIVSMAASSPAWCCCALRAAVVADHPGAGMPACCAAKVQANHAAQDDRACCSARDCGEGCPPCRCADREIEQPRLDTALRLASVPTQLNGLVALTTDAVSLIGALRAALAPPGASWRHPPPRTLLSQGCLLQL